ncbi:hypothetical protein M9H77_22767 [Catharanthus roseus]|uniref:Uncharacterized protein n=1 Tax=Catharanthus roseus TaxID=4058 RepID=A0ACC0ARE0_CATRO|nr:hypothetical protein M9H77_22767 [Catharanthus roseus]
MAENPQAVREYVPPHPPQSGSSTFEEKVLSALKSLELKTQILDSHTQSIAKLETQIGQLANAISRIDDGKLPSHSIENPRANYHEQTKAIITLRNGKLVDNKVGEPIKDTDLNENEIEGIDMEIKIEKKGYGLISYIRPILKPTPLQKFDFRDFIDFTVTDLAYIYSTPLPLEVSFTDQASLATPARSG